MFLPISYGGQWRQSGLKSGGSWIRLKNLDFPCKFPKNVDFFRQFHKKFQFFQENFRFFIFLQAISQKISIFQEIIGHFQQLLGKLFYISSKVSIFEHTSCT